MKTLKVMGITGLVLAGLSYICMVGFVDTDCEAALGWGLIATAYLIAISIVCIVQAKKLNK